MPLSSRIFSTFFTKFFRLIPLLIAIPSLAQRGAVVHPADLAELTNRAQTIIRARVMSARLEPHPQFRDLQTVVLTLAVKEAYKGNPGSTLTIRQFVWDIRDKMDSMGYRKGQEYILFLNPTTRYGLTSTTGLDQGRFRISTDSAGNEVVANSSGNYGLLGGSNTVEWAGKPSSGTAKSSTVQAPSTAAGTVALPTGIIPVTHFVKAIKSYVSSK
jgi:hypothetical protein